MWMNFERGYISYIHSNRSVPSVQICGNLRDRLVCAPVLCRHLRGRRGGSIPVQVNTENCSIFTRVWVFDVPSLFLNSSALFTYVLWDQCNICNIIDFLFLLRKAYFFSQIKKIIQTILQYHAFLASKSCCFQIYHIWQEIRVFSRRYPWQSSSTLDLIQDASRIDTAQSNNQ